MKVADVEEIEKVFNETFVPASDHDFMPITMDGDCYGEGTDFSNDSNLDVANKNTMGCREIFFAHRTTVPDPDEVKISNRNKTMWIL